MKLLKDLQGNIGLSANHKKNYEDINIKEPSHRGSNKQFYRDGVIMIGTGIEGAIR